MATTIESSWENERLMEENLRLRKELVDLDDWVKRVNQAAKTLDADCNGVHPTAWPKDKLEEFMRMAKMPPNVEVSGLAPLAAEGQLDCRVGQHFGKDEGTL